MKTKIKNPTNAFISLQNENEKILIDPWVEDGIFLNTWHNFPRVSNKELKKIIRNVDICLITHLHKDHFNINTIKNLNKETKFLLPKVFGWEVMHYVLKKYNFTNIEVLECGVDKYESKTFFIQSLPPLNTSGLEENLDPKTCIDAGFVLIDKKTSLKLVFLADDNLYNGEIIDKNLELIYQPDLIAFAYSGFATDFPFNYKFNFEEKIKIINDNEDKRFEIQTKNLKKINPKYIMPYSSEFVPIGKHAKNWIDLFPYAWTSSKFEVAKKYADRLKSGYIDLYPDEYAEFDKNKVLKFKRSYDRKRYNEELLSYYNKTKEHKYKYEKISYSLEHLFKNCYENWKQAINKHKFTLNQNINFYVDNYFFKSLSKDNLNVSQNKLKEPFLSIYLKKDLFLGLMSGNIHWNDAVLSLRLNWERKPNIYCDDVLSSLNYFRSNKKIIQ